MSLQSEFGSDQGLIPDFLCEMKTDPELEEMRRKLEEKDREIQEKNEQIQQLHILLNQMRNEKIELETCIISSENSRRVIDRVREQEWRTKMQNIQASLNIISTLYQTELNKNGRIENELSEVKKELKNISAKLEESADDESDDSSNQLHSSEDNMSDNAGNSVESSAADELVLSSVHPGLVPVSFVCPRKDGADQFQEDIFPDTLASVPAINSAQFEDGEEITPLFVSMDPAKQDEAPTGAAAANPTEAPSGGKVSGKVSGKKRTLNEADLGGSNSGSNRRQYPDESEPEKKKSKPSDFDSPFW